MNHGPEQDVIVEDTLTTQGERVSDIVRAAQQHGTVFERLATRMLRAKALVIPPGMCEFAEGDHQHAGLVPLEAGDDSAFVVANGQVGACALENVRHQRTVRAGIRCHQDGKIAVDQFRSSMQL